MCQGSLWLWRLLVGSLVLPMDGGEQLLGNPLPHHFGAGEGSGATKIGNLQGRNPKWKTPMQINRKKKRQYFFYFTCLSFMKNTQCTALQDRRREETSKIYIKLIYNQFYGRMKCFTAFTSHWLLLVMSVPPWCTAVFATLESIFAYFRTEDVQLCRSHHLMVLCEARQPDMPSNGQAMREAAQGDPRTVLYVL